MDELREYEWRKHFRAEFSLFSLCLLGTAFTNDLKKTIGCGRDITVFTWEGGTGTIYQPVEQTEELTDCIVDYVQRTGEEAVQRLYALQRQLLSYKNESPASLLATEQISRFTALYRETVAYYNLPYYAVEGLDKDTELYKLFAKARKRTEDLFPQVEIYLENVFSYVEEHSSREHITALTPGELRSYVRDGELPEQVRLDERFSQSVIVATGECTVLTGEKANRQMEILRSKTDGLQGTSANAGEATGEAVIVENEEDLEKVDEGDILVTVMTRPGWTDVLRNVDGIVTEAGARLSHAAIIAREFDIPCLMYVEGAMEKLENGETIRLDCNTGTIERVD